MEKKNKNSFDEALLEKLRAMAQSGGTEPSVSKHERLEDTDPELYSKLKKHTGMDEPYVAPQTLGEVPEVAPADEPEFDVNELEIVKNGDVDPAAFAPQADVRGAVPAESEGFVTEEIPDTEHHSDDAADEEPSVESYAEETTDEPLSDAPLAENEVPLDEVELFEESSEEPDGEEAEENIVEMPCEVGTEMPDEDLDEISDEMPDEAVDEISDETPCEAVDEMPDEPMPPQVSEALADAFAIDDVSAYDEESLTSKQALDPAFVMSEAEEELTESDAPEDEISAESAVADGTETAGEPTIEEAFSNDRLDSEVGKNETPICDVEPEDCEKSAEPTADANSEQSDTQPMSSEEIAAVLELGQEAELAKRIGFDKLEEYKKQMRASESHRDDNSRLSQAYAYRGVEYTDHKQDDEIRHDYDRSRAMTILRLIASIMFCGLIGFVENIRYLGYELIDPFDSRGFPVIHILTLTALIFISASISWKCIIDGIVSMFKLDPIPHATTSLAVIASIIYDIVMLIVLPEGFALYNFPASVCICFSALYDLFCIDRERNTFDVVSAEGVRYAPEREAKLFEDKYNKRRSEQSKSRRRVYDVTAAGFTDGYFRHTNEKRKGVYILNFMLFPALAVGFVECLITLSTGGGQSVSLASVMITIMMCLPCSLMIALTLPPLIESVKLKKKGCAIIGDSAVDEFSKEKLLIFEDRNMFPADGIRTNGLKIYDGFEVYDVLIKTGSLFAAIGGPLGEIFENESASYHRIKNVRIVRTEGGGVEAILDGKTNIIAGSAEFVAKYGIYPTRTDEDRQLTDEGVISLIYIVFDKRPAARLYADYRTDALFEERVRALGETGDLAAIRTSDPGISEEMISRKRTVPGYELTVIRPGYVGESDTSGSLDAGVISLERPDGLCDAVISCHKLKKKRQTGMLIYFFGFIFNIVLASVLSVMKLMPYAVSAVVAGYMLISAIPAIILTFVKKRNKG